MLTMRPDQVETFRQHHLQKFEDEMVDHSKEFSPKLCRVIGDEQLRVALRSATRRANGYKFTNRGPLRLFIEMMFLFGSAFDTDPQYGKVGEVLRISDDQMVRAERIHQYSLEYFEKVSGTEAANVLHALKELSNLAQMPLRFSSDNLVEQLIQETTRIFPQKVAFIGEACVKTLIEDGVKEADSYGFFTVRQRTLIVILKFAFGHGCAHDPLYPWILTTLRDERIISPPARAERLEKKALTWLEHVLASSREEPRA
jgi:hypothetical protein